MLVLSFLFVLIVRISVCAFDFSSISLENAKETLVNRTEEILDIQKKMVDASRINLNQLRSKEEEMEKMIEGANNDRTKNSFIRITTKKQILWMIHQNDHIKNITGDQDRDMYLRYAEKWRNYRDKITDEQGTWINYDKSWDMYLHFKDTELKDYIRDNDNGPKSDKLSMILGISVPICFILVTSLSLYFIMRSRYRVVRRSFFQMNGSD